MYWVLGILALAAFWYFYVMRKAGNLPFWKAAADHPTEAMIFFKVSQAWFIDEKPTHISVLGPYLFADPLTGKTHKIYAQADVIEETQEFFLHDMQSGFKKLRELASAKSLDKEIDHPI